MSIIESIRTFICACPFLKDGALNVDYLGDKPTEYTVDGVPVTEIIKTYADGGTVRQYVFIFASREYYGKDALKNIANSSFYEDFAGWLKDCSDKEHLPALSGNRQALKIEALSTGYMLSGTTNDARYQIQCRLTYYEGV